MTRIARSPANIIVPRELLLSWAAGLVRAVCAPTPDEIAEPVRETARQMTLMIDRATARAESLKEAGIHGVPDYPVAHCVTCKEPLRYGDRRAWQWLSLRRNEAEHDDCYRIRFAEEFPAAHSMRRARYDE